MMMTLVFGVRNEVNYDCIIDGIRDLLFVTHVFISGFSLLMNTRFDSTSASVY